MWSHVSAFFTPCSLLIFSKFHQNSIKFECIFELFAQWKTRFVLSKKVFKNCIFHWFWALFRNFCKTEKFSQVQKCLRIFTVAPCKYTGDHRQIMGRSWAVSRIVQNYAQIVPNPYIITSAEVVPRNRAGLLRTWPLLIVILRISSTHFLQRVRVKNSKSGAARARARARLFSRLRNFAGGLAKVSLSEAIRFR